MLHSNKVDKSNAFQFRVADFVSKIFKSSAQDSIEREYLWQRYSSGIDSCAKIYGFCVDFVYSEAFKVLGGVNRSNIEDEEEETGEKKKKKGRAGLATLERNPEAITTTKFEFATTFDPYYKQLSAAFDSAGSRGLLLAHIRVNEALELMLSSEDKRQNSHMDVEGEIALKHLLPPFEDLALCKEMEEYEAQTDLDLSAPVAMPVMSQLGSNWEVQSEDSAEEMPLDFDAELESDEVPVSSFKAFSLEDRLSSIVEGDDYEYFNNPRLSSWAGFEYWNRRNMPNAAKPPDKRKRREAVKFFLEADVIEDPEKTLAKPGKGARNTMTGAHCSKVGVHELKLPDDYEVSLRRLTQVFTRPYMYIKKIDDTRDVVVELSHQASPLAEAEVLFASPVEASYEPAPQAALQFAKTSKRVDVKLLKETIWKDLLMDDKENIRDRSKPKTFMNVLQKLPSSLPQSELENLSMHSCFITMLHLANEHSNAYTDLVFEPSSEIDFRIIPSKV
jgi:condensin complex subunit 2